MRIYLDACCLNRPFDDQSQERIRLESEAILLIMTRLESTEWSWVGSDALDLEIDRTPDRARKARLVLIVSCIHIKIEAGQSEIDRAQDLEDIGFHAFDALHIACAEACKVDVFLTTDDRLLAKARRFSDRLKLTVRNPLDWISESVE